MGHRFSSAVAWLRAQALRARSRSGGVAVLHVLLSRDLAVTFGVAERAWGCLDPSFSK